MSPPHRAWLPPTFLALVAFQAWLALGGRVGLAPPLPAHVVGGLRLAAALLILAILAAWAIGDRRARDTPGPP